MLLLSSKLNLDKFLRNCVFWGCTRRLFTSLANTVNTCLLCETLKILIGNMLNAMKESPSSYPFSCVSHLEWNGDLTFLPCMNSSEIQYKLGIRRVKINSERKNWIGCYYRFNRYVYGASFMGEYLHLRYNCRTDVDSCY